MTTTNPQENNMSDQLVFVYGTLKRGFHNFPKYLENSGARFVTWAHNSGCNA